MAYIAKKTVLKAYKVLSSIDDDKRQGLTQKVSALKYGIALAMYFKKYKDNCDLKNTANKDTFASLVGKVVKINDSQCTKDFYTSIAPNGRDYDCGSNFYSQSSVKDSKTNTSINVLYPKRSGWRPVMDVSNQVLIYNPDYIESCIYFYLNSLQLRYAFVIWILRFESIETKDITGLKQALKELLTDEYCNVLISDGDENINNFPIEYDDVKCELTDTDIKNMFIDASKEAMQSTCYSQQQIFYGAPGTGKSHEINRLTEGEDVIRTTFHPDTDYSTFVGCYKPHMEEVDMTTVIGETLKVVKDVTGQPKTEKRIVYKYSCQAFLQAYIAAWQHPDKARYLVIEEINRGNCAQIFGDIFQLLDRNDEGYSSYPIKTDADAENELRMQFGKKWNLTEEKAKEIDDLYRRHYPNGITKSIKDGSILLLPSNLYIWATMNTSDQSLFPIDSAFKRRWDWKYMKIAEGRDSETKKPLNWVVKFDYEEDGKPYTFECSWWQFIMTINEKIATATSSDDKKLGYFFCKPKTQGSKVIDAERFVGKVVFYLWNDVFKDEDNVIFKVVEGKGNPSFDAFYTEDENGKTIADTKALRTFMHNVFGEQSNLYTETAKELTDTAKTVTE